MLEGVDPLGKMEPLLFFLSVDAAPPHPPSPSCFTASSLSSIEVGAGRILIS